MLLVAGCGQPAVAWHLSLVPALDRRGLHRGHLRQPRSRPFVLAARPLQRRGDGRRCVGVAGPSGVGPTGPRRRPLHGRLDRRDAGARPSRAGPRRRAHGERQSAHRLGDRHHHGGARPGPAGLRPAAALLRDRDDALPADVGSPGLRGREHLALAHRRAPGVAEPRPPGPVRSGARVVDRSRSDNEVARVRVPCLVLAFEHDVDSPPRYARAAAEAIPGCVYREVEDAGHLGIITHAGEVARHMLEFFAGC